MSHRYYVIRRYLHLPRDVHFAHAHPKWSCVGCSDVQNENPNFCVLLLDHPESPIKNMTSLWLISFWWRHRALDLITHYLAILFIVPFFKFYYNKMLYNLRCFFSFYFTAAPDWSTNHNNKPWADSLRREMPRLCLHMNRRSWLDNR